MFQRPALSEQMLDAAGPQNPKMALGRHTAVSASFSLEAKDLEAKGLEDQDLKHQDLKRQNLKDQGLEGSGLEGQRRTRRGYGYTRWHPYLATVRLSWL